MSGSSLYQSEKKVKQIKTEQDVLDLIQNFINHNKANLKATGLRGLFSALDPMVEKIEKEIQKTNIDPDKKLAAIQVYLQPDERRYHFFSEKLAHRFYSMVYHGLRLQGAEKQFAAIESNFNRIFERPAFRAHQ